MADYAAGSDSVDQVHPNQELLLKAVSAFLSEVENLCALTSPQNHTHQLSITDNAHIPRTPGNALEDHLNTHYGPGTHHYDALARLIKTGLDEGWVANVPIAGSRYRRSRVSPPCDATRFCSVTTVYMATVAGEDDFKGQYHAHPYGEINCVVPIDADAQLMGLNGWQGQGWTSPHPGSHHYPQCRGGGLVALFFLPAGRISYDVKPGHVFSGAQ